MNFLIYAVYLAIPIGALVFFGILTWRVSKNSEDENYINRVKKLYRMMVYLYLMAFAGGVMLDSGGSKYVAVFLILIGLAIFLYLLIQGFRNWSNRTWVTTSMRIFTLFVNLVLIFVGVGPFVGSD